MNSRREFLKHAATGVAVGTLLPGVLHAQSSATPAPEAKATGKGPMLGMASYTLRKFPVDQAIAMVQRLGLKRMVFKDAHLPLNASEEQIKATMAKAQAKGIEVYGCGTVYMKNPTEVEQAFRYAKTAGMKMIIGAPSVDLLPLVEQKVKDTGIILAIHNHGPDNPLYPSPLDAYNAVKKMDPRMGLCMDIGHTQRLGQNPVEVYKTIADRCFDIHTKDVSASTKQGKTVEIGRGVIDMPAFLKTLVTTGYSGTLDFEHEKDADDPLAGVAESIGYVRGVLKLIA